MALVPGFYDLRVWLSTGDPAEIAGRCTFGYRVNDMQIRQPRPADFHALLGKRPRAEIAKVPLNPVITGPIYDPARQDDRQVQTWRTPASPGDL